MPYEITWRDAGGTVHVTEESGQAAYDAIARIGRIAGADLTSVRSL